MGFKLRLLQGGYVAVLALCVLLLSRPTDTGAQFRPGGHMPLAPPIHPITNLTFGGGLQPVIVIPPNLPIGGGFGGIGGVAGAAGATVFGGGFTGISGGGIGGVPGGVGGFGGVPGGVGGFGGFGGGNIAGGLGGIPGGIAGGIGGFAGKGAGFNGRSGL
jgi:hypothetical protein